MSEEQLEQIMKYEPLEKIDQKRIDSFPSYARFYIQGEVNQFLRENQTIKVSKDVTSLQRQYDFAKERLIQQLGRIPTQKELSYVLEVDIEKIEEIEQSKIQMLSLDYQKEDTETPYYNYIQQEEIAFQAEFQDLHQAIQDLPSPEKEIILAQFFEGKTQMEVAEDLGMSQVQVYRKKAHGLQSIKQKVL